MDIIAPQPPAGPPGRPSRTEVPRPRDEQLVKEAEPARAPAPIEEGTDAPKETRATPAADADRLRAQIRDAADRANTFLARADTHLEFEVREQEDRTIIRVIDNESGEVVREIPPEELTRFSDRAAQLRGLLFDAEG